MRLESLLAWLGLTTLVVGYDLWAVRTKHETMSHGFWSAARGKYSRWLLWPGWALLTFHLFNGWPA